MTGFRLDFGQGRWFNSSHLHHFNYTTMSTKSETDVAYTKGYAHGFLIATDTFQEILEKSSKDVERLDWLLDENSCIHIERGRYNRFRDWLVKTLHNRSDIDRDMKTYDFNEIIRDEELNNE